MRHTFYLIVHIIILVCLRYLQSAQMPPCYPAAEACVSVTAADSSSHRHAMTRCSVTPRDIRDINAPIDTSNYDIKPDECRHISAIQACLCLSPVCFKLSNLILSHYSFIHLDYVYIIEHFRLIFVIVLMSTFNIQIMKQVSKFFVVHVCLEIRNEWSSR